MTQPTIDARETSAILAGLRLLQAFREDRVSTKSADLDVSIDDIETSGGEHEPMTPDEIDELCERINVEGALGTAA